MDKIMRERVHTMPETNLATYRSSNTCMSNKTIIKLQHAEMTTSDVDPLDRRMALEKEVDSPRIFRTNQALHVI